MTQRPPVRPVHTLGYAPPRPRDDLRTVAVRQKGVIYCILGYLVMALLQFILPPELGLLAALLAIGASITAAVFVFMLAITLYGTAVGIILGILTLIPLIGLIVLLVVNTRATRVLRENRVHVGFMGARLKDLPAVPRPVR